MLKRTLPSLITVPLLLLLLCCIVLVECNLDTDNVELPELPYSYDALEPHIDEQTMTVHHKGHHQAYTTNLNAALETLRKREEGLALLKQCPNVETLLMRIGEIQDTHVKTQVKNNGGGYVNHKMFWNLLTPPKSYTKPSRKVMEALETSFGSYENFVNQFNDAATKLFGSGWVWVIKHGKFGALKIESFANQDSPYMDRHTPVLGIDVWEHAYYLKHQNKRANYIKEWWNVVNWKQVEQNLEKEQDLHDEL